ncbi:MAG: alpha/beta fold hydrolase [Bacteroidetes bacterium]|nr:MAG: alpha/beta fold hydrolase [Bacteroidota bacterium]
MDKDILYHEIHHSTHPDAEWLIFIHGAGGSTRTWRRQVDDLKQTHHLLLIDLPGHGQMANRPNEDEHYTFPLIAQKVWAVVDHLNIAAVHLVGVSLGAIIALQMREQRPDTTLSVILSGPILKLNTKLKILANLSLGLAKIIGYPAFYKLSARIMMPRANHRKSREVFIREAEVLTTSEFKKWTQMYFGLNKTLRSLFHQPLRHPHLLVSGAEDHLFLYAAKAYAKFHSHWTQLHIVPRCGHVVSIEKAQTFNELCLHFLQALPTSLRVHTSKTTS